MQRWRAIVLSAAIAVFANSSAAEAGNYQLDSGDELRVSVLENPQLTGVYTVADDGTIALPALERISVRGLTLEQATKVVREKVVQRIVDPSIAIEISKYRPFFILGDVASPGMYPSMPGLSLVKAVAIAGGYRGKSDYFQMAISGIRAAESLAIARQLLLQTRVQIARLEAELSGSKTFEFAADSHSGVDASTWREIIDREQQLLHERTVSTERQLELLTNERRIRDDEIAALQARIETQAQEAESLKAEVREVQDLVRRGLAPTARLASINREEIRARSDALQTTILLNQSRQARNQIDLQLSTLERGRRMQVLTEIQGATSTMQRLRRQLQADEAVMIEANSFDDSSRDLTKIVFHVRRRDSRELLETNAENTEVKPGDVIRVERRLVKGGPQR